jgi:hypothetical protein
MCTHRLADKGPRAALPRGLDRAGEELTREPEPGTPGAGRATPAHRSPACGYGGDQVYARTRMHRAAHSSCARARSSLGLGIHRGSEFARARSSLGLGTPRGSELTRARSSLGLGTPRGSEFAGARTSLGLRAPLVLELACARNSSGLGIRGRSGSERVGARSSLRLRDRRLDIMAPDQEAQPPHWPPLFLPRSPRAVDPLLVASASYSKIVTLHILEPNLPLSDLH